MMSSPVGEKFQSQLLLNLSEENLNLLVSQAKSVKLREGECLFSQFDPGDAIYFVQSGVIEISIVSSNGKKISLNLMKSGDVLGEIATLDGGERTATATALEVSQLLRLSRSGLFAVMAQHPAVAMDIINVLCGRLRWINQQVEDLALLDINKRLASCLLRFDEKETTHDGRLIRSQSELADFVCVTRETVNKVLQTWRSEGLIELSRGSIRICNHHRLREIVISD